MYKERLNGLKIARVSSISFFIVSQLRKQIQDIIERGGDVLLVSGEDEGMEVIKKYGFNHKKVDIARDIHLYRDLIALFKLFYIFRKYKIDLVHSTTPKAGLLCAIAGFVARVPIRIHTFTGQVWATKTGLLRKIAIFCDKVIIALNTKCYADSNSQVKFLYYSKVIKDIEKIKVLGHGSLSGVDVTSFQKQKYLSEVAKVRAEYGISSNAKIILYLGRVSREKGVAELLEAFNNYSVKFQDAYLFVVGPHEFNEGDSVSMLMSRAKQNNRVVITPYTATPQKYLAAADLLCLPSYREGFGTVVLEAASMGLPTLGTKVQGLEDSILHNETGYLVPPKDIKALELGLIHMLSDDGYLQSLGLAAKKRVQELFDSDKISDIQIQEYLSLSSKHTSNNRKALRS